MSQVKEHQTAYLIARVKGAWRDIYGLRLDTRNTIGRVSGNQIVLQDEHSSRKHCAVFYRDDEWFVEDLGSSNGTKLNGTKLAEEQELNPGDIILIGASEFLFDYSTEATLDEPETGRATVEIPDDLLIDDGDGDGPSILERKRQTRFLSSDTEIGLPEVTESLGRGFRNLFRAGLQMASATTLRELGDTALECLHKSTNADIGAVLLFDEPVESDPDVRKLRLISHRVPEGLPYHNVSSRLSREALTKRESILGLDIGSDPSMSEFQTLAAMKAESVVCVPIQNDDLLFGLVHLYSLTPDEGLDTDALEFAMAVAGEMVGVVRTLQQRDSLSQGLGRAQDENRALRQMLEAETVMVGESAPMLQLGKHIRKLAASDAAVLIRGESGVGKELVSRQMHIHSSRAGKPLVCLNCAALTETLLESELFGHEKGAFTGATGRKAGKFEQADGGTLFLDEVGEMSPSIQAKFLRVLEGHPFERVGGSKQIAVDVRVVAATNRDLEEAVKSGDFRQDLYYRLQVLELYVPPLREHLDDIPLLARWFLERSAANAGVPAKSLTPTALHRLTQHDWPGNVREFKNVIERSAVLASDLEIDDEDLMFSGFSSSIPAPTSEPRPSEDGDTQPPCSLDEMEKLHILRTLQWTGWVKRESARLLEIERSTLDRKIKRYGLEQFKDQ